MAVTFDRLPENLEMKITIKRLALQFVAPYMAKKDVRYYLNGVHLEAIADGTIRAVATDGHALMVARDLGAGRHDCEAGWSVIIPRDAIEFALKSKADEVTLESEDGDAWTVSTGDGRALSCNRIVGRFPDWRAVMPLDSKPKPDASPSWFNPELTALAAKAFKGIRGASVSMEARDADSVARIRVALPDTCGIACTGAVMPLRSERVRTNQSELALV